MSDMSSGLAIIVYNLLGFELIGSIGDKIDNPEKTIPKMSILAGVAITVLYVIGTFGMLAALPAETIDTMDGFYYALEDKGQCGKWAEDIRQIWNDKDVVVVEGERTHNGVGNDLLDTAKSIERIIGPSAQAYAKVDEILSCCKEYPKDRLFLVSLGVAAKFLVEKLFLEGYRALDIGNLDMEYEWYLHQAKGKEKLAKHDIVGEEANREAGYDAYLAQIRKRISL